MPREPRAPADRNGFMDRETSQHDSPPGIIQVEDLSLGYGERVVLEHMTFSIRKGEIVSVLGGSGCGKSTLMKALIGLLKPLKGRIFLEIGRAHV